MKRERDWLDYIQTASSVGQNIQLGGIKGVLKELQGIEERKQFDERQLVWFRKCLFRLEDDFDAICGSPVFANLKMRLWAALKIQHCLQGLERFSAVGYEDKDRHRSLAKRLNLFRTEAEKDLPPDMVAIPAAVLNLTNGKIRSALIEYLTSSTLTSEIAFKHGYTAAALTHAARKLGLARGPSK